MLYLFEGLSDHFIYDLKTGTTQVIEHNYAEFSPQVAPYAGVPTDYSAILRHASKYTNYLNVLFDAENDRYYQLLLQPVPDTNGGMESYLLVFDGELRYLGSAAVPRGILPNGLERRLHRPVFPRSAHRGRSAGHYPDQDSDASHYCPSIIQIAFAKTSTVCWLAPSSILLMKMK